MDETTTSTPERAKLNRELAQMLHPDKFGENKRLRARAEQQMRRINEARDVLLKGGGRASHSGARPRGGARSGSGRGGAASANSPEQIRLEAEARVRAAETARLAAEGLYGAVSFVSYFYFLLYELFSPYIEVFGVFTMVLAWWCDLINVPFMLLFFLIYAVFGSVLTLTAFFSRIYTADLTLSFGDGLKAVCLCLFELVFLRFILAWVRCTAFIGYRKKKLSWGRIERRKIDLK
mgnify:CR=1 FL=1